MSDFEQIGIDIEEFRALQTAFAQIRSLELGAREVGVPQVDEGTRHSVEASPLQFTSGKIDLHEPATVEIRVCEVGSRESGTTNLDVREINPMIWEILAKLVPRSDAIAKSFDGVLAGHGSESVRE